MPISTFALALEALERGHSLYHYLPRDLIFRHGSLFARARSLFVQRVQGDHYRLVRSRPSTLAASIWC